MRIEHNFDLSNYNSYRIKSSCNRALFPTSESDFINIFSNKSTKKIIIGGGNNIIFSKAYYNCDIVIVGQSFSSISLSNDNLLACDAGATTLELSEFALSHSLSGAEIFYDIPSSLGGAVVMNAGASGEEIKDILIKVRYLDLVDMSIKEIKKEDIDYQYRNSIFQLQTDKIVLKVWIKLEPGDKAEIKNKMENIKNQRWAKQPRDLPNCGSVFKRPKGYYVGQLIDDLGLKGFRIGDAEISTKHGGFIVNKGTATGKDILQIIETIQHKVFQQFGIELEIEQRII